MNFKTAKRIISGIMSLIMILSLAACSGGGTGKNIVYPIEVSPETLDPQYADDTGALIVINNIFEGLVRYDRQGKIIPGIAKSWQTSEDGLTWTFKLKTDTEWYCPASIKSTFGDEFYKKFTEEKVTANDFVYACQRTVDPEISSPHAHRMLIIENATDIIAGKQSLDKLGVTAKGKGTLEFKLTEPCENFLDRLTESEFMPCNKEFYEKMKGRYGINARHIICNGPFYVSSWDPESTMTCKVNKYYAGEQSVAPSSIIFAFENNTKAVLTKLSTGNLSCALIPPDCDLPENTAVQKELRDSVYGFMFNCKDAFMGNGYLRRALANSVDRKLFAADNDKILPQKGLIPPICNVGNMNYCASTKKHTKSYEYSEEDALFNWERAYSTLNTETVSLNVICPEEFETPMRKQFQIWQKLFGVNFAVSVTVMEAREINEKVEDGDYQIAIAGIQSVYTDALGYISQFIDGGPFNYRSTKFMEIVGSVLESDSETEIIRGCYKAESFLLQQAVCYPLYTKASRFVTSDGVEDIAMPGSEKTISFINAKRHD